MQSSIPSVVRTFLFNDEGEILITKHHDTAPWVLPGGHIESGESLHQALKRELHEEFSLDIKFFDIDSEEILHHKGKPLKGLPLPIAIYELQYTNKRGEKIERIEHIFLTEISKNSSITIDTKEIVAYQWIDVDSFLTMQPNIDTWDFYIEILERVLIHDFSD